MPADFNLKNSKLHPALQNFQNAWNYFSEIRDQLHLREIIATYYGMISCMDDQVGQLLDELDRLGISNNTYVIYTSDHGDGCGEHGLFSKLTPYDNSAGVPLIISGPGIPKGKRIDDLVSLIDIFPTVLEMTHIPFTGKLRTARPGASLLPLIRGEEHKRLDHIFCEHHGNFFPESWYMLVRGDFKYVHHMNDLPQLFNLEKDPCECTDLTGDSVHSDRINEFEKLLRETVDIEGIADRVKSDFCIK